MTVKRSESSIERSACRKAFQLGVRNRKMNGAGNRSWPDRMFLIPGGRPLFIEFKRPGEEPEPLQAHNHEMLRGLGYQVEVCDNVEDAMKQITKRCK